MNAAEITNGAPSVLRALGYSFESWKIFDRASEVYRHLLMKEPKNPGNYQDLAWSLYQEGKVQEAVRILYSGIILNMEEYENFYGNPKAAILKDMNAMISIHSKEFNFSFGPKELVVPMPVDLRIVITNNAGTGMSAEIREPGGVLCYGNTVKTKNGGYFSGENYHSNRMDYNIRAALKGKYRISLSYYGGNNELPMMYRIITYRHFGNKDQRIEVRNVMMNNQSGHVEINEVEW